MFCVCVCVYVFGMLCYPGEADEKETKEKDNLESSKIEEREERGGGVQWQTNKARHLV